MEPVRQSLALQNFTRDAARAKGSWGTNVIVEGIRARKRPGFTRTISASSTGQGLFNWQDLLVQVQGDVLKVGTGSYTL